MRGGSEGVIRRGERGSDGEGTNEIESACLLGGGRKKAGGGGEVEGEMIRVKGCGMITACVVVGVRMGGGGGGNG